MTIDNKALLIKLTEEAKNKPTPKMKKKETRKEKRTRQLAERDKRNGAIDKDILFGIAAQYDEVYKITATIDSIAHDDRNFEVMIVSINTIRMTIDGIDVVANHTHIRSDRFEIDTKDYYVGDEITLNVRFKEYRSIPGKYEIVEA